VRHILNLVDRINAGVTLLVGFLLAVTATAVMIQVLVRFVLTTLGINLSAPWTEELARYSLIWMVFLGAGVGCRNAQMIALEFVVRSLPRRFGVPLRYLTILTSVAFFVLLIVVGLSFVDLGRTETSPVMNIQKSLVYWALPVGAGLMIVNSFALILETVLERRDIRNVGGAVAD
jgi:TRAP-type C4-dicarboxylate transport system permease small subunit